MALLIFCVRRNVRYFSSDLSPELEVEHDADVVEGIFGKKDLAKERCKWRDKLPRRLTPEVIKSVFGVWSRWVPAESPNLIQSLYP